jgi:UDP-GlcNAc:undecaprenyl-phosphate GlcNAc-1-phosphate transferase
MWLGAAIAIAVSLALTPLAEKVASRFDAVSRPDGKRRLQPRPIPVWGGLAVYLSLLAGLLAACILDPSTRSQWSFWVALCASAGLVCLLGCYDDLRDMDARWKLAGQIVATLPIAAAGCWVDQLMVFGYSIQMGWLGVPWTVAWLVLGMNAMNLIDGMDGLASSIGIAAALTVAWMAAPQGIDAVMLPALVLAGGLAGFLVYNLPPARIYLGDCGSMLTGLIVSALAMVVSFKTPGTMNLTIAVVLLLVPLLDTALAIIRRTLNGRHLMVGDRGHVHHRLLDRGFRVWGALGSLAGLSLATGATAWLTIRTGSEWMTWTVLGALAVVLVKARLVGHEEWALFKNVVAALGKQVFTQGPASWLTRWSTDRGSAKLGTPNEASLDLAAGHERGDYPKIVRIADEQAVHGVAPEVRRAPFKEAA